MVNRGFIKTCVKHDDTWYEYSKGSYLQAVNVTMRVGSGVDEATLLFANPNGVLTDYFEEYDEVELYYGLSQDSQPNKFFSGFIQSVESRDDIGYARESLSINCVDWTWITSMRVANRKFENKRVGYIVKKLVEEYLPEFSTSGINENLDPTLEEFTVSYEPLNNVFDRLKSLSDAIWYVDKDKVFHFFKRGSVASGLTYNTSNCIRLRKHVDVREFYRRVIVCGANKFYNDVEYAPSTEPDGYVATYQHIWAVPFIPRVSNLEQISLLLEKVGFPEDMTGEIREDSGGLPKGKQRIQFTFSSSYVESGYKTWWIADCKTELIVGRKYWIVVDKQGDSSNYYRWYYINSSGDSSWYSNDNVTWVEYSDKLLCMRTRYAIPIVVVMEDTNYPEYPFTDLVYSNQQIKDENVAQTLAQKLLEEYCNPYHDIEIETFFPNTLPTLGDKVYVVNPDTGLADYYYIMEYAIRFTRMGADRIVLRLNSRRRRRPDEILRKILVEVYRGRLTGMSGVSALTTQYKILYEDASVSDNVEVTDATDDNKWDTGKWDLTYWG